MSDFMSFKVEGLNELMNALKAYPQNLRRKACEPALKEITRRIRDDARAHAPKDTGELAKHIIDATSRSPSPAIIKRAIFVRKIRKISRKSYERMKLKGKKVYLAGFSSTGRAQLSAYYAHMVEYGHYISYKGERSYKGQTHGFVQPKPFMRPAVQRAKGYMKEVLESHISAMNAELGVS